MTGIMADDVAGGQAVEQLDTQNQEEIEPKNLDEQVAEILDCFRNNFAYREVFYKTLCAVEADNKEDSLLEKIRSFPEMKTAIMPPIVVLDILVKHGALFREPSGAEAAPADAAAAKGAAPAQAAQDATNSPDPDPDPDPEQESIPQAYTLTEAGESVKTSMAPSKRLDSLLVKEPDYELVFRDILAFCTAPKTLKEIEGFCGARDELWGDRNRAYQPIVYPSSLVDMLEKSGGLEWRGGWVATDIGRTWKTPTA